MDQLDNFIWLVVEIIKEMTKLFTIFLKFKLQILTISSNVIAWSIQDMDIQLFGLERNSSLLLGQEKRKIAPKWNVRCIILISIFGLKCLISTLEDIITHLAVSMISLYTCSVVLPTQQENISILLKSMIMIRKRDGRQSRSAQKYLEIDKVVESFKEITKISLSSVVSLVDS